MQTFLQLKNKKYNLKHEILGDYLNGCPEPVRYHHSPTQHRLNIV